MEDPLTTTASEAKTPKMLRDAATFLERDGWCQDQAHDDEGRHCALGAMQCAAMLNDIVLVPSIFHRFAGFLGVDLIHNWNDAPERTAEEVIKSLRAYADHLGGPDGGSVDYQ